MIWQKNIDDGKVEPYALNDRSEKSPTWFLIFRQVETVNLDTRPRHHIYVWLEIAESSSIYSK